MKDKDLGLIEEVMAAVPLKDIVGQLDGKSLKRFINVYSKLYNEKFADKGEGEGGLSVDKLVRDYKTVKSELDERGFDYQVNGTLNTLSGSLDKSLFGSSGDEVELTLDKKGKLTDEINVYYVGQGDLWIESDKSIWVRRKERDNPLQEEPDLVIDDGYKGDHLAVEKGEDGTLVKYDSLALAHDISLDSSFEASLATRRFAGKDDEDKFGAEEFNEIAEQYSSIFLLVDEDLGEAKELEQVDQDYLIGPTEWICSLGRVNV